MRIGCVLLASGFGRRFGANKLLEPVDGVQIARRMLKTLSSVPFYSRVVVSQYAHILSMASDYQFIAISNPDAQQGISASIRLGLAEMQTLDGVLFSVCDQPWLAAESVSRLVAAFESSPECIAALSWQGQRGNPVLFPRKLFSELLSLSGENGGGKIIRQHPSRLLLVEAGSARELHDVDTQSDLSV